jgi:hypothetical protein
MGAILCWNQILAAVMEGLEGHHGWMKYYLTGRFLKSKVLDRHYKTLKRF